MVFLPLVFCIFRNSADRIVADIRNVLVLQKSGHFKRTIRRGASLGRLRFPRMALRHGRSDGTTDGRDIVGDGRSPGVVPAEGCPCKESETRDVQPKPVIRFYGRFVLVMSHGATRSRHRTFTFHAFVSRSVLSRWPHRR